nr:transcriptional activator [Hymenolepis microstoma]
MSDQKEEILTANASRFTRRRGRGRITLSVRRRLAHREEEDVTGTSPASQATNNNSSDGNSNQMTNISDMTPIDPDDECVICRDRKVNQSFLIPCMHTYCYQCILRWVRINPTCPLCKAAAQKIIHSINSDTDFREYEIRSHHIPSGIHIHSSSPHMLFTFAHDILASGAQSPSHAPAFNPLQLRTFELPSRIPNIDPRAEALIALTSHTLRSVLCPNLLRRLAYVNRLVSFPTNSTLPICTVFEVIAKLRDSQPRSMYIKNLEVFCRREIGFLAPWLDYSSLRTATQLEVACKPIGSQALCVTSRGVKSLSRRIVQSISSNPYRLNNVNELALEIRRLDRYTSGGDEVLQLLSGGTLIRFAWEIIQFSRFNGSVDQYYDEISLFRDDTIRLPGDPVLSNAVYSPTNRSMCTGFAHNFDDICRSTAQWLFRKLIGSTHSPYTPPASLDATRPLEQIGCSLRNSSMFNPRSFLERGDFNQNRIDGIRALLSFMCIRYLNSSPRSSMIELIDMARIYGMCNRISSFDHRLLNKRLANLILAFSSHSVELGSLHDVSSDGRSCRVFAEGASSTTNSSHQLRVSDDPHLFTSRFIVVSDEDSSSSSDDDVQFLSETRPTNSSLRNPPCCRAHKRHCCCCKKRAPSVTTNEPNRKVEGISALFQEFLEYWEHRRKRRRVEPIEINTPNDPIVISDDERENEPNQEPGPSTRHPEDDVGIVRKTEEDTELKQNILPLPTSTTPPLERPETADEFYTLLNDAMNCDSAEEAQQPSANQQEDSSAFLPQIEPSQTSDNGETSSQILFPNSAPTPLSEA